MEYTVVWLAFHKSLLVSRCIYDVVRNLLNTECGSVQYYRCFEISTETPLLLHQIGKLLLDITGNKEVVDRISAGLLVIGSGEQFQTSLVLLTSLSHGTG